MLITFKYGAGYPSYLNVDKLRVVLVSWMLLAASLFFENCVDSYGLPCLVESQKPDLLMMRSLRIVYSSGFPWLVE